MGRGKSKVSCFNIMSCAGDGGDRDEMEPLTEAKDTKSRRRWSFQGRSSKDHCLDDVVHQVPNDSGTSVPVSASSDKNELYDANKNETSSARVPEEPDPPSSIQEDARLEALPSSSVHKLNSVQLESAAITLQTVIRGYLAKKELLKLQKVIKLQAVWRGHIVRKQAAGTLRCIQAIVKMQALVRARQKGNKENLEESEGSAERFQMNDAELESTGKESSNNGLARCPTTEKVLRNAFARLILDSTPRKKPIYISCDSSRSSSAWRWLDMWMVTTFSDVNKLEEPDLDANREERMKKVDSYIASHNTRDVHNLKSIQSGSSCIMKNIQEPSCIVKGYSDLIEQTGQDENAKEAFDSLESPVSPEHHIQTALLEDDADASYSFSLGSPWRSGDVGAEVAPEIEALGMIESESNGLANVKFDLDHVKSKGKSSPSFFETVGKDTPEEIFSQSAVPEPINLQTSSVCSTEASSSLAIEQSVPNELRTISVSSGAYVRSTTSTSESQGSPSRHSFIDLKNSATTEKCSGWKKNSNIRTKRLTPKTNNDSMATSDTLRIEDNSENASDPLQIEKNESMDPEPRVSISDSLPSYMQLTKSARARFHANNSKATSLDMDDNANCRNSLSLTFGVGKYDTSPRVLRSATQGRHSSKGKGRGPQVTTERNWQT